MSHGSRLEIFTASGDVTVFWNARVIRDDGNLLSFMYDVGDQLSSRGFGRPERRLAVFMKANIAGFSLETFEGG